MLDWLYQNDVRTLDCCRVSDLEYHEVDGRKQRWICTFAYGRKSDMVLLNVGYGLGYMYGCTSQHLPDTFGEPALHC